MVIFKRYKKITKKFLIKEYIKNKKTIHQIAYICNCCYDTIRTRLIRYNIRIRTVNEARRLPSASCYNIERYIQHYCKKLTCKHIISYDN